MTLEEQVLSIAEGPLNFTDCRKLRAIALEVRKREDRIKQLEDRIKQLEDTIRKALDENRHLADGQDCTLQDLKKALPEWR